MCVLSIRTCMRVCVCVRVRVRVFTHLQNRKWTELRYDNYVDLYEGKRFVDHCQLTNFSDITADRKLYIYFP